MISSFLVFRIFQTHFTPLAAKTRLIYGQNSKDQAKLSNYPRLREILLYLYGKYDIINHYTT